MPKWLGFTCLRVRTYCGHPFLPCDAVNLMESWSMLDSHMGHLFESLNTDMRCKASISLLLRYCFECRSLASLSHFPWANLSLVLGDYQSILLIMAKFICTCFLFLLMIVSHEVLHIEGRSLELKRKLKCVKCLSPDEESINTREARETVASPSNSHNDHSMQTMEVYVDAFRPTTPGHSPGVGHSLRN